MSFVGKTVLVTGATGSWGYELTKQLLEHQVAKVVCFARNELAHVRMQRTFREDQHRIHSIVGDVRDRRALREAMRDVDYVFHLAALKHVPVCEAQPWEAVQTNIQGTQNLIDVVLESGRPARVVLVSTDKAVAPYNLYGMTKGVAERLVIQANERAHGVTRFSCIRAGNVLGSNGSVVPLWIDQIKQHNRISVTDPTMTRFYLTLPEAISLIFVAFEASIGGETFVMNMPACNLMDLGNVLMDWYGDSTTTSETIGSRPGEKKHEVLISEDEALFSYQWGDDYWVILPIAASDELKYRYEEAALLPYPKFSSDQKLMTRDEITNKLKSGGFLE